MSEAIEAAWRDKQDVVFADVDRAVRQAIDEALQASQQARARRIDGLSREVADLTARRDALRAEVEGLRAEADVLRPQLATARQTIEDLERRRRVADEAQRALTREAETRRRRMLGEIEELAGQVSQMRANLLGLLGSVDGSPPTERPADGPPPAIPADPAPEPAEAARPLARPRAEPAPRPTPPTASGLADALDLPGAADLVDRPAAPVVDDPDEPVPPDLAATASTGTPALDFFAGAAAAAPAAPTAEAEGELPAFELLGADGDNAAPDDPAPAPAEPRQATVKITNLANLAEGMQLRKTMRNLPGIVSLSFPQFRDGTMTMTVRHERGPAFAADVVGLPAARLSLVKDGGETIEFCVGK